MLFLCARWGRLFVQYLRPIPSIYSQETRCQELITCLIWPPSQIRPTSVRLRSTSEAFFIFSRHDNTNLRNTHRTIKHHHRFSTKICPPQTKSLVAENLSSSASRDISTDRKSHIKYLKWPVERENQQAARQDRKRQQEKLRSRTVQRLVFRLVPDFITPRFYPGGSGEGHSCNEGCESSGRVIAKAQKFWIEYGVQRLSCHCGGLITVIMVLPLS